MRRTLLLREPLRRRPYGERTLSQVHAPRRSRTTVIAPRFVPAVTRRGADRSR
jgi:hypothetical protein